MNNCKICLGIGCVDCRLPRIAKADSFKEAREIHIEENVNLEDFRLPRDNEDFEE